MNLESLILISMFCVFFAWPFTYNLVSFIHYLIHTNFKFEKIREYKPIVINVDEVQDEDER